MSESRCHFFVLTCVWIRDMAADHAAHVAGLEAQGYALKDKSSALNGWWRNQDAFARNEMLGSKPPPPPAARVKERPAPRTKEIQGSKLIFGGDRTPEVDPTVGYMYLIAKRRGKHWTEMPMQNSMIGKYTGAYENGSKVFRKFEILKTLPLKEGDRMEGQSGVFSLTGNIQVFDPQHWSFHELARVSTLRGLEDRLPGDVIRAKIRPQVGGRKKTLKRIRRRRRSTRRRKH
jgi:hypothetical protein